MGHYQNFKSVIYCIAQSMADVTAEDLQTQINFFQQYVGVDKVYLEPYRDDLLVSREQLSMCKKLFAENGIEVAAGITTTRSNLTADDSKRQRLFNTYCYTSPAMRQHLKDTIEYIASQFDELIIDDFFFTQCTCEDCQAEKGDRSWQDFRTAKMVEVSRNLVLDPARTINPDMKITIKFPNWAESYQETGYNPEIQKDLFDMIYTGTETRHASYTDQHLPRYLSYSLMRYMENTAPGRNGGGWFDPYQCYPIDCYLEQAYLTVLSQPKEVMMFCWPSLYQNKLVTPMKLQLTRLDEMMSKTGACVGLPVYLPHHAQGEDHLEDYLGMAGIPFEPMPDFPVDQSAVFLTAAAACDPEIIATLRTFVNTGGKAIVTSGFVRLMLGKGLEEMTSIRYRGRFLTADAYHYPGEGHSTRFATACPDVTFPLLEHRNNATWSLLNASHNDLSTTIFSIDTYGKGQLYCLNVPDDFSRIRDLPQPVLTAIRQFMSVNGIWLDAPADISLFTYRNDTVAIYSYAASGAHPETVRLHVRGNAEELLALEPETTTRGHRLLPKWKTAEETVFELTNDPGSFRFFRLIWNELPRTN